MRLTWPASRGMRQAPTSCRCTLLFAGCGVHGWRRFERAAKLPLTRASLLHSAWPVMLQRKGVGCAPTGSDSMGIILCCDEADSCALIL